MKSVFINLHGNVNMTAAYLHSLIDKAGFDITTVHFRRLGYEIDLPSQIELDTLKKCIDKLNPDVVMMSVNSMSFWTAIAVSKLFKDKKIIFGGVQPMIDPESCLKHVDIIVRGEGDEAIIELLTAIENNKPIYKIKNVWCNKDGKIIRNDFRPLVQNLDLLPLPDYTDNKKLYVLDDQIYKSDPLPHSKYAYNITFSRGCPFNCTYCLNHFLNKEFKYRYLRKRSVQSVIAELKAAKKQFPELTDINFWDDVFLTDMKWLREFVKEYKEHIDLPFFAYGNANFVTEESMKLLKEAGISFFDLGLQSGSERIRRDIFGRTDTNDNILKADKIIHKHKINVGYDLIFSEFETEASIEEGINYLLQLQKPFKVQRNKLAYYPNFIVTNRALKEKLITEEDVASMSNKTKSQVMNTSESNKEPLMNYFYFLGRRYIPNFIIRDMLENKWHITHPKLMARMGSIIDKLENNVASMKGMLSLIRKGEYKYVYNRIFKKGFTSQ
jgi:radical SAM superfamily enzyme YgiQ (UPF0313 family)